MNLIDDIRLILHLLLSLLLLLPDQSPYYGKKIAQSRYVEYIPECSTALEMGLKILNNFLLDWQCVIGGTMDPNIYLDDFSALLISIVPYNAYQTRNHKWLTTMKFWNSSLLVWQQSMHLSDLSKLVTILQHQYWSLKVVYLSPVGLVTC